MREQAVFSTRRGYENLLHTLTQHGQNSGQNKVLEKYGNFEKNKKMTKYENLVNTVCEGAY